MSHFRSLVVGGCGLVAFSFTGAAGATILTFDQGTVFNFQVVSQDYGDDVEATLEATFGYGVGAEGFTPNIQLSYGNSLPGNSQLWTTGYGDLTNILFEDADFTGVLEVTLTADTGFLVELFEFDLAAFSSAFVSDPTIDAVTITDGTSTLFQQLSATVSRTTHTTFDFTAAPLTAGTILIQIDARNLGSLNDDIGIDNIRFGQVVPEPSTALIFATGLIGLAVRRRHVR